MYAQSKPYPEMIAFIKEVKAKHHLKIVMVSNEGRELMEYRIKQFRLVEYIDVFIISGLVKFRKPDLDIFRLALDVSQASLDEIVYIDDREVFIQVAREGLGIHGIHHQSVEMTRQALVRAAAIRT
jgi:putative hydrolase of the HAD superfamily